MNRAQSNRPGKVGQAVILLYATLAVGVVRMIVEGARLSAGSSVGFVMLNTVAVFAIIWFLIHKIGKGRNWARITFTVLFLIGVPFSVLPLVQSVAASPVSGMLGIAQAVIQAIALVLLFQKPSSHWFSEMKSAR